MSNGRNTPDGGLDGAGITTSPPTPESGYGYGFGYGYDVGSLVMFAAAAGIETVAATVGLVW